MASAFDPVDRPDTGNFYANGGPKIQPSLDVDLPSVGAGVGVKSEPIL
jgi:hypothetical protein